MMRGNRYPIMRTFYTAAVSAPSSRLASCQSLSAAPVDDSACRADADTTTERSASGSLPGFPRLTMLSDPSCLPIVVTTPTPRFQPDGRVLV